MRRNARQASSCDDGGGGSGRGADEAALTLDEEAGGEGQLIAWLRVVVPTAADDAPIRSNLGHAVDKYLWGV